MAKPKKRKKRKETYDRQVIAALAKTWEILDYSYGQRLKPLLQREALEFTRCQANRKNDDASIEEKNWRHARNVLRYLTPMRNRV